MSEELAALALSSMSEELAALALSDMSEELAALALSSMSEELAALALSSMSEELAAFALSGMSEVMPRLDERMVAMPTNRKPPRGQWKECEDRCGGGRGVKAGLMSSALAVRQHW
jgi:hypothetical protein